MIREVADLLARSRHAIAFTGSGISAESGVPTFRGPGGVWEKFRPEEVATPNAFSRNPALVWRWYVDRIRNVLDARPNTAHIVLARLEEMGLLKAVITQNVDGLHQRAGSRTVVELHGNILRARCTGCGALYRLEEPPGEIPPRCGRCGSLLRPDVVWFGEPLPEEAFSRALALAEMSDMVLVVGTSMVVMPAAMIPYVVKNRGGVVVEVNLEETPLTPSADYSFRERATVFFAKLAEALEIQVG